MPTTTTGYKLPPRFIQDCFECGCDVGDYENGHLVADFKQLGELRSRAEFYADPWGPDGSPHGLRASAKALLKAMAAQGV